MFPLQKDFKDYLKGIKPYKVVNPDDKRSKAKRIRSPRRSTQNEGVSSQNILVVRPWYHEKRNISNQKCGYEQLSVHQGYHNKSAAIPATGIP